jgi:hypothetical protein
MRERLLSLPGWVLFLATAVAWVAALFAVGLISADDPLWAIESAAVVGVPLGAGTTLALKFGERAERRALGDLPPESRQAAIRAARKGPAPADPGVRAAALRLAEQGLQRSRRPVSVLVIGTGALVVADIALAVLYSEWILLLAAPVTAMIPISVLLTRKRLRARVRMLSEPSVS